MRQDAPRLTFPEGSLLAAMLGDRAPVEVRRAVRRLRAEGAPALAVDDEVVGLADGLARSDVSRSPAVPDALPPLFWLEARRGGGPGVGAVAGWIVERKDGELFVRGFRISPGREAAPEPDGTATLRFDAAASDEDDDARHVRGLIAAAGLPGMLSQMGESSPVALVPADAPDRDAEVLRGIRLSVAVSSDSLAATSGW